MNKEDELFLAKKTAEEAGYTVIMPNRQGGTQAPQAPASPRRAPSIADQLEQLAQAARTAEAAGYRIRKAPRQVPQGAAPATPAPAAPATPAPAAPAKPAAPQDIEQKPAKNTNPYLQAAARFAQKLNDNDR